MGPKIRLRRIVDNSESKQEEVFIEEEETFLGRGPLLKIDATNISRKHVRINISRKDEVQLTCIHKNFIFVKQKAADDSWKELHEGKTVTLGNGGEFKFLLDNFHFQLCWPETVMNNSNREDIDTTEKLSEDDAKCEQDAEEKETGILIKPKPTGLMTPTSVEKKKRQLPDWMMAAGSSGSSLNKKKPSLKEEEKVSSFAKTDMSPNKPTISEEETSIDKHTHCSSGLSEEVKEKGSPGKNKDFKRKVKDSFINDEEESEKELCDEDIEEEAESLNLLSEISEEPSKKKAEESSKLDLNDDEEGDKENKPVSARKSCPYGSSCYRRNPVHRKDEAHPGDGDYNDPDENNDNSGEGDDKPECEYGIDCYRKNPQHRKDFQHTKRPQRKRAAAEKVEKRKKKKKKTEDDYDSDESFIDDEEDGWEPVDDSDDDADFEAPADMSSDFE